MAGLLFPSIYFGFLSISFPVFRNKDSKNQKGIDSCDSFIIICKEYNRTMRIREGDSTTPPPPPCDWHSFSGETVNMENWTQTQEDTE